MMNFLNSTSAQTIMTAIILVGGIVFAIAQWGNGRSQRKSDVETEAAMTIRLIKEARDALEAKLKEQNLIVIQQGKDIASLQAQIKAKDELIERYVLLLQNRNPELESYMKSSMESLKEISDGIKQLLNKPTIAINNTPAEHPKGS